MSEGPTDSISLSPQSSPIPKEIQEIISKEKKTPPADNQKKVEKEEEFFVKKLETQISEYT